MFLLIFSLLGEPFMRFELLFKFAVLSLALDIRDRDALFLPVKIIYGSYIKVICKDMKIMWKL